MPRGVYPRKKKFPARNLRQTNVLEYSAYKQKEKEYQHNQHITHVINSIEYLIQLLKDIING